MLRTAKHLSCFKNTLLRALRIDWPNKNNVKICLDSDEKLAYSGCWAQDNHSENSTRGISEDGDYLYLFLQVKIV